MRSTELITFLRKKTPLFFDFSEDRLSQLVDGSQVTTFEPNEIIIEFGEEGRFLGVLLEGEAQVSTIDDSGEEHQIAQLKPGDIFGEISLMTGDKTIANVVCITRCSALIIPQSIFSTVVVSHPSAIKFLSRSITERSKNTLSIESQKKLAAAALRRSDDPYGFKLASEHPERLLIVNCGSSSLKYTFYDTADEANKAEGLIERIGAQGTSHKFRSGRATLERQLDKGTHREAFDAMIEALTDQAAGVIVSPGEITAVGHRVVHGGERFMNAVIINEEVIDEIEKLIPLAPLHNPINVLGIRQAIRVFPLAPHVAVFDTAFHNTLPPYAYLYGLPYEYYEKKGVRRYGFHGSSHLYVSLKAAEFLKRPFNELEIISCHLGNGASLCAVDHGRSIDTTMGLTPSEGLLMGTRCGDIDPGVLSYLIRSENMTIDQMETLINKQSGLLGISGVTYDMREIEKAAQEGNHRALLAYKTFCYRVRKYIGAYIAAIQGLDVLIFTGGIGQGSASVRSLSCQGLGFMGIHIDEAKNRKADGFHAIADISTDSVQVRILVIPTDEQRMIARETIRVVGSQYINRMIQDQKATSIPIEVSAHHVHLSADHVETLFGKGYQLTPENELSQPGQFACKEVVALVGPKGRIEKVRVLGPVRQQTQVEISMTEQFKLGIDPPIRESGDMENTPGITIEGAGVSVSIDKGVICAHRHVHMSPEDALRFGLRDRYVVRIRVKSKRELIFGDVVVRVGPNFRLAMHLDTDEANAANIVTGMEGQLVGIQDRR